MRADPSTAGLYCVTITRQQNFTDSLQVTIVGVSSHGALEPSVANWYMPNWKNLVYSIFKLLGIYNFDLVYMKILVYIWSEGLVKTY